MSDSSGFSRPLGIVLALALVAGVAGTWWTLGGQSAGDATPASQDGAGAARGIASAAGADGREGGDVAPAEQIPAEVEAEGAAEKTEPRSHSPGQDQLARADRAATPAADSRATEDPVLQEAKSLEERARDARRQGRLDAAADYLEHALSLKEDRFGTDHPSVAETLGQLAGVYAQQGRVEDAEAAYLRAVEIDRQNGTQTALAATTLSDLALFYRGQGRTDDALPLLESALDIELGVFGKDHPNVASRLSAIGLLYRQEGLDEEAEPFLEDALLVRERVYGRDDPETTGSMTSLAQLYREQGRYQEAEDLFQRVLDIHEKMGDDPRVAMDLANLSVLYVSNSQFSDAEPVFERALRIEGKSPWSPTPMVAQGLGQLARSVQVSGDTDQAEEIYIWALDTSQRVLGPESPNTAFLRDQYILYLRSHGRGDEAEALGAS